MKKPVQKKKPAPKKASKPAAKVKPKTPAKKSKEVKEKPVPKAIDNEPTDDAIPSGALPEERQADLEPSEPQIEGE